MKNPKNGALVIVTVMLAVCVFTLWNREQPVQAAQEVGKANSGPRYTVVETQGHNLLVTDNGTNTVYFYTVEKGEKVGSDLKLRASVDLTQVGKDTIKIKPNK